MVKLTKNEIQAIQLLRMLPCQNQYDKFTKENFISDKIFVTKQIDPKKDAKDLKIIKNMVNVALNWGTTLNKTYNVKEVNIIIKDKNAGIINSKWLKLMKDLNQKLNTTKIKKVTP